MSNIFFSIIIPTYNRADFIAAGIDSVINQSFSNWELIIVDDGSTDNTREIVDSFSDPRIRYFYKEHEERSIARNFGIAQANGSYICFLDSDDIYYAHHLESLFSGIKSKDFPVAIFNTGTHIRKNEGEIEKAGYNADEFKHPVNYVWKKFLLINSVCVHSEVFKQHKFPEAFSVWEDTHLWLRVVAQYPFYQISEVTTRWNIHKDASVAKKFDNIQSSHVKSYLLCVTDLFSRYGELLQPYLSRKDMEKYLLQKIKMFLSLSFENRQYKTFLQLYLLSLRFMPVAKMSRFAARLIRRRLRKGDYNV